MQKMARKRARPVVTVKVRRKRRGRLADSIVHSLGAQEGSRFSMPYEEFFKLACYILKNEDLVPDDPRLAFLMDVKKAKIVRGWNGRKSRRIQIPGFWSHGEE